MLFKLHAALAEVFAEVADVHRLPAVLRAGDRRDDLRDDGAGDLETLRAFDELAVHDGAVVEHVADVDEAAVEDGLDEVIRVVEVQHALFVRLADLFGQEDALGEVLRHFARDEVALGRRGERVLVGVLLHHVFVRVGDEAQDRLVRRVRLAHERAVIPIDDVRFGEGIVPLLHQLLFDDVLNVLDEHALFLFGFDVFEDRLDLLARRTLLRLHFGIRFADRDRDLRPVVFGNRPVSLDDLHGSYPPFFRVLRYAIYYTTPDKKNCRFCNSSTRKYNILCFYLKPIQNIGS